MKKMIVLICCILSAAFVSCKQTNETGNGNGGSESDAGVSDTSVPENTEAPAEIAEYGLSGFDRALIEYLNFNKYYDSDFIVSPAAFRASLCLAAAGAEGNTRTDLVNASGFTDMGEFNVFYQNFQNVIHEQSNHAAVSVWNDRDQLGDFTDSYKMRVNGRYGADANVCTADEMTGNISSWISDKTGGLIPSSTKDVYGASSVLVSVMHMQPLWQSGFSPCESIGGDSAVFMEQTGDFLYAEESGTQILALPIEGNISFVCFTGNRTDMFEKMAVLKKETVHVVLPEFEMRSSFDASDLLNFLISRDVGSAINGNTANFYNMCQDSDWFLQEVIQEAKISVNTAGDPENSETAGIDDEKKEFIADGSFSFAIFYGFGTTDQQLLLYGQKITDDKTLDNSKEAE